MRLITATNRTLEELTANRQFRDDLYYLGDLEQADVVAISACWARTAPAKQPWPKRCSAWCTRPAAMLN